MPPCRTHGRFDLGGLVSAFSSRGEGEVQGWGWGGGGRGELTLISILSVIDPAHGHLEGIRPAATAHGHLCHVVNIIGLIVIVPLVEEAGRTQLICLSSINREIWITYYPAFKLIAL